MKKEEIEAFLLEIKPKVMLLNGTIEIVNFSDNEIKLKASGLSEDVFKVQGKIVIPAEETKKKIIESLQAKFSGVKVSFV